MNFDEIFADIDQNLGTIDTLREDVLQKTRSIVRMAAETIKAVHREEWDVAEKNITEMKSLLKGVREQVSKHETLLRRNYTEISEQEYAEAAILFSILHKGQLASPKDLEIPDLAWLLGLADVAGELRRHCLDAIRKGDMKTAEDALGLMEEIYRKLFSLDYPKGMTGSLREKTDTIRKLLQATRGEVSMATHMSRLNQNLEKILNQREGDK